MYNESMKQILCYGDSNTWGNRALSHGRIPFEKQWPNILQAILGGDYHIVQEGLPGRLAGDLQSEKTYYNGRDVFRAVFRSAAPVDIVVVSLGTNDLQTRYNRNPEQVTQDILWYASELAGDLKANAGAEAKIIFIAPANFGYKEGYFEANSDFRDQVVHNLQQTGQAVVVFNDLELTEDKVHYSEGDHARVADRLAEVIKAQES